MAYQTYDGDYEDEHALVTYLMQLFSSAQSQRVNFEEQWEEAAALCWPEYRNSFSFGHRRTPGAKYTQYQVDISGGNYSHQFMSICDAIITPYNALWSEQRAVNPYLQKQRRVQEYYNQITNILWAERYKAIANFQGQNQQNWQTLAVFGNHGMWIDELDRKPAKRAPGLRYISCSPGEIYILQNHQGREDGCIRYFQWTAREAYGRWPQIKEDDEKYAILKKALEAGDVNTKFDFLQFVIPRTDYDPFKVFSNQGKPYASIYVSLAGHCIMEQGGYRTYPRAGGRYMQAPDEWYGRGPTQIAAAELKTLNSAKTDFLKTGAMAGDPAYLLPEDGLFDFKATAGSHIFGAMTEDGKRLVDIMPVGNIQITQEMMNDCKIAIREAYKLNLFPLLFDQRGPQRSAREVVEMGIQQGIFLSPLARQYTEYCAPMNERELDILGYLNKLPPIPPEMLEAEDGGEFETVFTSPLARAIDMPAVGGFMRMIEMSAAIANATGDRSSFYHYNFKRAIPGMALNQRVPIDWMASPEEVMAQEKAAAQAAERDREVKEMPGRAAMEKARAITAKAQAGQNIGGTLSGVPEGQMPMMPGG